LRGAGSAGSDERGEHRDDEKQRQAVREARARQVGHENQPDDAQRDGSQRRQRRPAVNQAGSF
jgi:hypothetical protein